MARSRNKETTREPFSAPAYIRNLEKTLKKHDKSQIRIKKGCVTNRRFEINFWFQPENKVRIKEQVDIHSLGEY